MYKGMTVENRVVVAESPPELLEVIAQIVEAIPGCHLPLFEGSDVHESRVLTLGHKLRGQHKLEPEVDELEFRVGIIRHYITRTDLTWQASAVVKEQISPL
jgi:hypothetical protein